MGLFGFQIRPISGPEILDFRCLHGPKPVQNPIKEAGCFVPHHINWVLGRFRAVKTSKIDDFLPGNRPGLKTKQAHCQTYRTLNLSITNRSRTTLSRMIWPARSAFQWCLGLIDPLPYAAM